MIRWLSGLVQSVTLEGVVLDVHGVGYEVFLPSTLCRELRQGQPFSCSVVTHVREDAFQLFGFRDESERSLFCLLVSVSGVGPKTALAVVDKGEAQVIQALQNSDVSFFSSVPRLGKKTAQKILVELQSKVGALKAFSLAPLNTMQADIQVALEGMGFPASSVAEVIAELDSTLDEAQALKWCLAQLRPRQTGVKHA